MTLRLRSAAALFALLIAAACTPQHAPRPAGTRAEATAAPCTVAVLARHAEGWREVSANGFTFCVPPGWHGTASPVSSGADEVRWGVGEPPRKVISSEISTVRASDLDRIRQNASAAGREFPETIGGRSATIWLTRSSRRYYTTAAWISPRMWIAGEANSGDVAELQMAMIRTVHFTTR